MLAVATLSLARSAPIRDRRTDLFSRVSRPSNSQADPNDQPHPSRQRGLCSKRKPCPFMRRTSAH